MSRTSSSFISIYFGLSQDTGLFEIFRGFTFDVFQAYLPFCPIVAGDWNSVGSVVWLPHSVSDGIFSGILDREVQGRERSLDDEVISMHLNTVRTSFL